MHDAASRCHPVHRTWADRHHCAKAVTVNYFAVEQIRDRGEADVRMRADIDTLADAELGSPIWSKKMNGPTICRVREGNARRTSKPPRSRARGTIAVSIESVTC